MTFLEAALDILRREGKPLHFKDLTDRAMTKKLLTFVGRTPEVTMQTQLTAAVKKAPGSPFVRVKPGVFGLLRYPEMPPEEKEKEKEKETRVEKPKAAAAESRDEAERGRRRRRRGGRGRSRTDEATDTAPAGAAAPNGESREGADSAEGADEHEPKMGVGSLSAAARAAALAETGVLEGDDGDDATDMEDRSMGNDDGAFSTAATPAGDLDELDDDAEGDDEEGAEAEGAEAPGEAGETRSGEAGAFGPPPRPGEGPREGFEEGGRRRRRRRRRRGGEAGPAGAPIRSGEAGSSEAGASAGESAAGEGGSLEPSTGGSAAGEQPGEGGEGSGTRRIMTPIDAAIEILRGQSPGRGVHVRQLADAAVRRRLVHGEPNEAWRVMRTALAAEPRERLRAGQRPRVRAAGSGLYALARRPPDTELERAEHVFGEARRALRERTGAALERRIAELPAPAFEALARVLLQREGFGPTTFVKRVEGTIYVEALRGRGSRPSRCLVGLRAGGTAAGRRAIGELRAGIRARNQDEGLLLLAGRLADDAIAEWKQPGAPLEIADGQAVVETCIRHGIGVINSMVSVDFVDADFFAELAEG